MTAPTPPTAAPPAAPVLPATLSDPRLRRLLSGIVAAMTGVVTVVALLAFTASFDAIHQYASRSGGIAPGHAWMAPLFRRLVRVRRRLRRPVDRAHQNRP